MIADSIRDRIRDNGPISIASFMTEALFDPTEDFLLLLCNTHQLKMAMKC